MSERALYVVKGSLEVGDRTFHEGQMIVLEPHAEPTVKALTQATVMVLGGEPVGQRLIWWNFVSSSQARLDQAKADWQAGRMKLPDEDDLEFIPLPEDAAVTTRSEPIQTPPTDPV
jgi:redox-sensitive bicupin YhaK (pirin superfamily)